MMEVFEIIIHKIYTADIKNYSVNDIYGLARNINIFKTDNKTDITIAMNGNLDSSKTKFVHYSYHHDHYVCHVHYLLSDNFDSQLSWNADLGHPTVQI